MTQGTMSDPAVSKWKQHGKVYLWRYRQPSRHWVGWHMTADDPGCESLLNLLGQMKAAQWPSQQYLAIDKPTPAVLAVPNYRDETWYAPAQWKLKFPKGQVADEFWSLTRAGSEVTLILGASKLVEVSEGVQAVRMGDGDYAIGPEDKENWTESLSFWWMLK
jgi:hypothetical protein